MQTQKIIEQLGYSPNEAKVYLAALQLGESHVSDIAAKLKLPRSSVQVIVDTLHRDGLMNFYVKNRYKFWVAENPERLLEQIKRREEMVRSAMPQLSKLKKSTGGAEEKPTVRVFAGRDEIKHILDDMIETKHHILAIIPEDSFLQLFDGTNVFEDFTAARVRNFLRLRVLAPDTLAGRTLAARGGKELREVRFLPSRIGIKTASFIYGDKVALIMFNYRQPTAALLEDPNLRETKEAMFEELWDRSGSEQEKEAPKANLFQVLADSSPQALLITNEKIEIQYVNAAWERLFGYTLDEVKGQNPRMLQSGKTPQEVYERMWKTLKAGQPFQTDEIIDKRKDGKFFNLMTTVFPMRAGERLFYVQILDDITGRKRVEAMRKNFLVAAAETAPASIATVLQKLLEDSSFE